MDETHQPRTIPAIPEYQPDTALFQEKLSECKKNAV
jgi:hypothetical protein